MKKKIFIIIFFCLLCLPSLGMLFFKTDVSVEQRQVQVFPSIKTGGKLNVKFFDQLNDYFSDNFAFRQNLIEADAIIKKNVFRQSGNEKVIVGSKGYLFFSETLDDYLNNKVFAGNAGSEMEPDAEDVKGFDAFIERYKKGLPIERAAVENLQ